MLLHATILFRNDYDMDPYGFLNKPIDYIIEWNGIHCFALQTIFLQVNRIFHFPRFEIWFGAGHKPISFSTGPEWGL